MTNAQKPTRSALELVKSGIGILVLTSALGEDAMAQTNVKLGTGAAAHITSGYSNTAIGGSALNSTTSGIFNTALGSSALRKNTSGEGNVGLGAQSLYKNISGDNNVGIGIRSLTNNLSGSNNIGIGNNGGSALTGSNNISIGHTGIAGSNGSINIGTSGVHVTTTIAGHVYGESFNASNTIGNVAINGGLPVSGGTTLQGIFTGNGAGPQLRFQNSSAGKAIDIGEDSSNNFVIEVDDVPAMTVYNNGQVAMTKGLSVEGTSSFTSPFGHVALIKDKNALVTAGLAIQSAFSGTHDSTDNFITFFTSNGASIGSIEGNNAGSVQLSGAGSDYAEYLPKSDPAMNVIPTEIVGIRDGKIVHHGERADQFMIATGQAIVAGNRPSEDAADLDKRSLVSFIGQVPVQVRGKVNSGDFILASENGDGSAIALPASLIDAAAMTRVVGRAWESSKEEGLKTVNTAVGLDQTSLVVPALQRLEKENQELRERLTKETQTLQQRLDRLEKLLLEKSADAGLINGQ